MFDVKDSHVRVTASTDGPNGGVVGGRVKRRLSESFYTRHRTLGPGDDVLSEAGLSWSLHPALTNTALVHSAQLACLSFHLSVDSSECPQLFASPKV